MFELVAQSMDKLHAARLAVNPGDTVILGRAADAELPVVWDQRVSHLHAELTAYDNHLHVKKMDKARNPIRHGTSSTDEFDLPVGDEFTIGTTHFRLYELSEIDVDPDVIHETTFRPDEMETIAVASMGDRLELLSNVPRLMASSETDAEFAVQLLDLLLEAIPDAEVVAILGYEMDTPFEVTREASRRKPAFLAIPNDRGDLIAPAFFRWSTQQTDADRFQPSGKLIQRVLQSGESILHLWNECETASAKYTICGDLDWAFCVPVQDESSDAWCLYVSGKSDSFDPKSEEVRNQLTVRLRFTEVLAQFIGANRRIRRLERIQSRMSRFFSPAVRRTLSKESLDAALQPRQTDTSVLFCDLRGFSLRTEHARHNLHDLLERVNESLAVMTRNIAHHGGVIADFQGDAALAFWGWPTRLDNGPVAACRAALAIYSELYDSRHGSSTTHDGFHVGIGVGYGPAIAGQLGSDEPFKVGVFGPVVNATSRLEGMTKHFRVPIIINESAAEFVRQRMDRSEARLRKLGRICPMGLRTAETVFELLPPENFPGTVTDDEIFRHELGVEAFTNGCWPEAMEIFDQIRVDDRAKDLLMFHIARSGYKPAENWGGVIPLSSK